ncbi:MAG: lipid-A-disaccharide synthase [Pseudanabaenaceae cyanobacterium bins.68]|nr:lipid-A-disaccharide synthase [Pseudanabaenaceae cyanobacterium bins.68]
MDILILANAPGELTTWVYPLLGQVQQRLAEFPANLRISIILSPCSNASGQEVAIATSLPGVSRVLPPDQFWQFLIWGKAPNWDWHGQGIVIFLGGDQIYTPIIAKRLGYRSLVYAEWVARWPAWVDHFALRHRQVKLPLAFQAKATVVGDLMADREAHPPTPDSQLKIAFLPGSKGMKLAQGVPLSLAIADLLQNQVHQASLELTIILAPSLTPQQLATYAQATNPVLTLVNGQTAELMGSDRAFYLQTPQGTRVKIYQEFPADQYLSQVQLCITTIGANTAELGALGIPMIVLIPTNQIEAMRGWDGLLGLLVNLPGVGTLLAKLVNQWMNTRLGLLAWPNIWAGREIVPELRGKLTPQMVADLAVELLNQPARLQQIRQQLKLACQPDLDNQELSDRSTDKSTARPTDKIIGLVLELLQANGTGQN